MGRAWHGRAVTRGRVASGRAESCKCTVLRVGRIVPLARERSHVILVRHIGVTRSDRANSVLSLRAPRKRQVLPLLSRNRQCRFQYRRNKM